MVDQLVMLLSADWFEPYWNTLGIDIGQSARTSIQQGCRGIVGTMLTGEKVYYNISFAPERLQDTRSRLQLLINKTETTSSLSKLVEWWDKLSDEDEKAAWIWNDLTSEIFAGRVLPFDPVLREDVTKVLFAESKTYDMEPYEFAAICSASATSWDQYSRTLTPELPTALADTLASALTARRFEGFWSSVHDRLTVKQEGELIAWFRKMAVARGRRDIVPSFVR